MIEAVIRYMGVGPLPLIFCGILAVLVASAALGGWLFDWRVRRHPDATSELSERSLIVSCVFGLLGLLIAFTFGLALDRHEERRQLVVDEANAIGSAHLAIRLLPQPASHEATGLLRRYGEVRMSAALAGEAGAERLHHAAGRLRAELERVGEKSMVSAASPQQAMALISSINALTAVGVRQEAMARSRLPGSVSALLLFAAIISSVVLGNALGRARRNWRLAQSLLLTLLSLSLLVILDLDRARGGAIQISQEPMIEAVAALGSG